MKIGLSWLLLASLLETGAVLWHFGVRRHSASDDPAQLWPSPLLQNPFPDASQTISQTQEIGEPAAGREPRMADIFRPAPGTPIEISEPPSFDSSAVLPKQTEAAPAAAMEEHLVKSIRSLPRQALQSLTQPVADPASSPPRTREEEDRMAAMEQRLVTTIERDVMAAPASGLAPRVLTSPESPANGSGSGNSEGGSLSIGQLAGGTVERVFTDGTLPWVAMSDGRRLFEGAELRFGYRIQEIREKSVILDGPNGLILVPYHSNTSE